MAKAIKRFELKLNGEPINDLDELKDNYNSSQIREYFEDGTLLKWLNKNYYEEEAEAVESLLDNPKNVDERLCEIFDVEFESASTGNMDAIIEKIKGYTDDPEIINHADQVAFSQGDLADLLDQGCKRIYLCGTSFSIPIKVENVEYIGINCPIVKFKLKEGDSLESHSIRFENVEFADGAVAINGKIEQPEIIVDRSDVYYIETISMGNNGSDTAAILNGLTGLKHMSRDICALDNLRNGRVDVMDVLYCEDKEGNTTRISENVRDRLYYNVLDFVEAEDYVFYAELGEEERNGWSSYIYIIKYDKMTKNKSVIYEGTVVLHNDKSYALRKSAGRVWDVRKNEQLGDNMLYVYGKNLIVRFFQKELMMDFNGENIKPLMCDYDKGYELLWTLQDGYYGIKDNSVLTLVKGRNEEDIYKFRYIKNIFIDGNKVIVFDYDGNYSELVAYYYGGEADSEVVKLKKFGREYAHGTCYLKNGKITLKSEKGNIQVLEY